MPNDTPDWTSVTQTREEAIPGSPFTIPRNGLVTNLGSFTLPAGVQAIVIVLANANTINNLTIVGSVTGVSYVPFNSVAAEKFIYCRLHQAIDPAVTITVTGASGGGTITIGMAYLFGTSVMEIDSSINNPVFLTDLNGFPITFDNDVAGQHRLGVSMEFAAPAPWQRATLAVDINIGSLANNTTALLLAGVAGEVISIGWVHIGYDDISSGITLEDSQTGNVFWRGTYQPNASGLTTFSGNETNPKWVPMSIGGGLRIHNTSGGTRSVFGTVYVSQV